MKHIPLFLAIILLVSCQSKNEMGELFYNAKVYSVDTDFTVSEAMYIKDGKVVKLGTFEELKAEYAAAIQTDLGGKYVYPGLRDPHSHFLGYGLELSHVNLKGTESFDQIVEKCKIHYKEHPSSWLLGRGWDQNDWEVKEFPDNKLLDEAFPDVPVLLVRIDGHAAIANTMALELGGVSLETVCEGGEIIKKDGKLTGVLVDNAISLVRNKVPEVSAEEKASVLLEAQKKCFAVGLVSVGEAGVDFDDLELIKGLQAKGNLKMRIYAMLNPSEKNISEYVMNGVYQDDRLTISSIKLFADGALGSRGALLIKDYSDDAGNIGLQVESYEKLKAYCDIAYENGYQVNTHCIGDSANRLMLNIYGSVLKEKNDRRWRIEHSQIIDKNDFDLFGQYSIIPSIQTTHATSDMYWADERLGDRIVNAYAYKDLLDQNGWLPNGSDFPIESINPLFGFYAGVVRKDQNGWPEEGFQMENALSREEALRAMTIWAAKANFEEKQQGSLETGKFADFVVLDEDLMLAPEENLYKIKVLSTFIDGKKVY